MALLLNVGDTVSRSYSYTQPSPLHPIQPQSCGERTGNLFDAFTTIGMVPSISTGNLVNYPSGASSDFIPIGEPNITLSQTKDNTIYIMLYDENKAYIGYTGSKGSELHSNIISGYSSARFAKVRIDEYSQSHDNNLMLNLGSTALPYEPYGYKIPILSNSTTTPVYLGEVQSTRKIKKLVLTGQENDWYKASSANVFINYSIASDCYNPIDIITVMCTHYDGQVNASSVSGVSDLKCCFRTTAPTLYIGDNNYTDITDFTTYLAQQYAAGTPVTVWYVLATPETAVVNEPIRKIGDYADEVSNVSIPTIAGANTISVGTTLQPSEASVNYKGWHPVVDVHEAENGQWD